MRLKNNEMKKNYLTIVVFYLLVLISMSTNAQDSISRHNNRHEISIILDDIFARTVINYSYPYYDMNYIPYYDVALYRQDYYNIQDINPLKIGLGYKLKFKHTALRTKISFGSEKYSSNQDGNRSTFLDLTSRFFIGYEFQKKFKRLQIFYGVDGLIDYSQLNLDYSSGFGNSKTNSHLLGYGVCPVLGVQYFLLPNFSISTEINFTFEYYKSQRKYSSSYSGYNSENTTDTEGYITQLGPKGNLGINLYFK
jgi:hypothetical protein